MVDPFSLATGIAGLLSLTIEIVSISYAYGSSVKGAPKAISSIVQELLALKNILSDLQNNVILNPDIAEAFEAQSSSVLERLGGDSAQHGSASSDSQIAIRSTQAQSPNLLDQCKSDLQDLLEKFKKKADHGTMRTAISNLTWPLSESENQKKIDMLHRYQSMFQASVNIDTLALVAKTHQTIIGIRDEKEDLKRKQAILEWLSPLSFAEKQRDANSRRHPETGKWLLDSSEFQNWEAALSKKERLDKLLGVAFDNLQQPISSSPPSHACTRLEDLYPVLWCDHCRKALDISKTNYYHCCDCDDNTDMCKDCVQKGCPVGNVNHILYLMGQEVEDSLNVLWCPGEPGAGKTTIASMVVQDLIKSAVKQTYGVAYLYIYYDDQTNQSPSKLLGSLVKQLALQLKSFPAILESFYDKTTPPDVDRCIQMLEAVSCLFSKTFIVIDALDESDNDTQKHRKVLLGALTKLMKTDIKIFATSRTVFEDINNTFARAAIVKISAKSEDLRIFLTTKIEESDDLIELIDNDDELKEKIITTIIKKSDGQFLLPALHIDRLSEYTCRSEIEEALDDMTGSIEKTYGMTLERFDKYSPARRDLAMAILMWLAHSKEPLTINQLREALAVKLKTKELDRKSLRTKKVMLDVCLGLVVIESNDDSIRLVHFTLQEYLASQSQLWPNAETSIANTCLTYLLYDTTPETAFTEVATSEELSQMGQLLEYAMQHWSDHARHGDAESVRPLAIQLFQKCPRVLPQFPSWAFMDRPMLSCDLCGYASIFFLPYMARLLIADGTEIHTPSDRVSPMVYWAGRTKSFWKSHEYLKAARNDLLLLAFEDEKFFERANKYTHNYIIELITWIDEPIRRRLLEIGFDVNWKQATYSGETALHLAVRSNRTDAIDFLIENGADVNMKSNFRKLPSELGNPTLKRKLEEFTGHMGEMDVERSATSSSGLSRGGIFECSLPKRVKEM